MTPVTRSHVDSTIAALIRVRDGITQTIGMLHILRGLDAAIAQPAIGPGIVEADAAVILGAMPAPPARVQPRRRRGRPRKPVAQRARRSYRRRTPGRRPSVPPELNKPVQPTRVAGQVGSDDQTDAAQRRAQLFALIDKSAVGLTTGELREKTPRMTAKDRQNSLARLKELGQIRRAGNTWTRVRPDEEDA